VFETVLIANRGEIACRAIASARRLGMRAIAVYSEVDADALHVRLADAAVAIGPAPAVESYLRGDAILDAARAMGAEAIHPGYGFLAENAEFATACAAAGVVFVGPPPEVLRLTGDKAAAKRRVAAAGVSVVPGAHGAGQDDETLTAEAMRIGFPLLIKPVAGGGGKGMRRVDGKDEFARALAAARREAGAAFADDRVILERLIARARHVEVQIFADAHGNLVHLFDRDCSIQRRHQKVIEEAPAPDLGPKTRAALAETALNAARAVAYQGAGTVEFLLGEDGDFAFIEINARLQVDHPVTEMVTGIDLVDWQFRVAAGEPLPLAQAAIPRRGHAVEARLFAEDPAKGFLPVPGPIAHLALPAESSRLRIDCGIRAGDVVSPHYDPLIAKIVAACDDRAGAWRRLRAALARVEVVGPATNRAFLAAIANDPEVAAGPVDTGFVARRLDDLPPAPGPAPTEAVALAALDRALPASPPAAPWETTDGWRLNAPARRRLVLMDGDRPRVVVITREGAGHGLDIDGERLAARATRAADGSLAAEIDGVRRRASVVWRGALASVFVDGDCWRLRAHDPLAIEIAEAVGSGHLTAPMPGRIVEVLVAPGAEVAVGARLLVLEAMKMEHTIAAPRAGRVVRIAFAAGAVVEEGAELIVIDGDA